MTGVTLPVFPPEQLAERRAFFATRIAREGWGSADVDALLALENVLQAHAPGTVLVPPPGGPCDDTDALLDRGEFALAGDLRLVNGRPRECHSNVARKWVSQKVKRLSVVTGYCLDGDGLWRRHSWMVDAAGRVTETTSRRVAYFGIRLDAEQADLFADLNL